VLLHLAAFRAVREVLGEHFKAGVKLFIEGEEEAGSPSFTSFISTYREQLAADYIIVADSANWRAGIPALTTSLRGVASGDIEVRTGSHAVHSGIFGGPYLDAHTVMARLIATLHTDDGSVAVNGLVRLNDSALEYAEEDFRADSGILDSVSLAGHGPITSRLWHQPAISVIGMDIPSIAESSNTLAALSRARISTRLAPGDTPEHAHQMLAEHLAAHAPFGAEVSYTPVDSGLPFAADTQQEGAKLALAAMRSAWEEEPVQTGMGGSIPFISDLKSVFPESQILITGVEDPDTRAHSANESLYIPDFKRGILAEALMISELCSAK
jgi:M20 family peptidase